MAAAVLLLAGALLVPATVARSQTQSPADQAVDEAAIARMAPVVSEVVVAPDDAIPLEYQIGSAPGGDTLYPIEVLVRKPRQRELMAIDQRVKDALGARHGGSWIDADGRTLTVGVTSVEDAAVVTAEGAIPILVEHTYAELQDLQDQMVAYAEDAGVTLRSSWIEVTRNMVVVDPSWVTPREIHDLLVRGLALIGPVQVRYSYPEDISKLPSRDNDSTGAGQSLVGAPQDPRWVDGQDGAEADEDVSGAVGPELLNAGNWIDSKDGSWCTLAFAARKAGGVPIFLTAGHCVTDTKDLQYRRGNLVGIPYKVLSTTGGHDSASGLLNGVYAQPTGLVEDHGWDTPVPVVGQQQAPVGAAVCVSGARSGLTCGRILAHDLNARSNGGDRVGFTMASTCTNFGDSGAPVVTLEGQAQGVHSGRFAVTEGCVPEFTQERTYFEPIDAVLAEHDATLQLSPEE